MQKINNISSANGYSSLSELIKEALRRFLASEKQKTYDLYEIELINRADRPNQEAENVLTQPTGL